MDAIQRQVKANPRHHSERVPTPEELGVTEADILHLVQVVSDQLARKYGVDPCELWGQAWLGVRVAMVRYQSGRGAFLPFARKHAAGGVNDAMRKRKLDYRIVADLQILG